MAFVNLTPHTIRYFDTTGRDHEVPSSGVARVSTTPGVVEDVGGVLFADAPTFGAVEGLPDPAPGVVYIVSAMVAARCIGRDDVVSPGTGPADGPIRKDGQVHAVTRFVRAPK